MHFNSQTTNTSRRVRVVSVWPLFESIDGRLICEMTERCVPRAHAVVCRCVLFVSLRCKPEKSSTFEELEPENVLFLLFIDDQISVGSLLD